MSLWSLYIIECQNGHYYTGITTDVTRRFKEHKNGSGSKYLRGKGPLKLVFHKEVGNRSLATKLERKIKKSPRQFKEKIIAENLLNLDEFNLKDQS